ncbi:MAG: hypothetical protein ACOZJX_07410 [Pseudomonadota bacterium]
MRTELLHEDANVRLTIARNESEHLTLCFTGVGHAMGGVDVQDEEFHRASSGATAVYVIDKHRSWGNRLDFPDIAQRLAPLAAGRRVCALGNSMGGFLAILMSRFMTLQSVVAIVPQFSVSKAVVPSEDRWDRYVDQIREWRFESLEGSFLPGTNYYVLAGYTALESRQLDLFPSAPNIHKIFFQGRRFEHNVAMELKAAGLLYPVIADCFDGSTAEGIVERHLVANGFHARVAP